MPTTPTTPPAAPPSGSGSGPSGSQTPRPVILKVKVPYEYTVNLIGTSKTDQAPEMTLEKKAGVFETTDISKDPVDLCRARELHTEVYVNPLEYRMFGPIPPPPPPLKVTITVQFTLAEGANVTGTVKQVNWDYPVVFNAWSRAGALYRSSAPAKTLVSPGHFAPNGQLIASAPEMDYNDPKWQEKTLKDTYWHVTNATIKSVEVARSPGKFEALDGSLAKVQFFWIARGASNARWHPNLLAKLDVNIPPMDRTNELKNIITRLLKVEFGVGTSDTAKMKSFVEMATRAGPIAGVLAKRADTLAKVAGVFDFVGLVEKLWVRKTKEDQICLFLGGQWKSENMTLDEHGKKRDDWYKEHKRATAASKAALDQAKILKPQVESYNRARIQFPYLPSSGAANPVPEFMRKMQTYHDEVQKARAATEPIKKTERALNVGIVWTDEGPAVQAAGSLSAECAFPIPGTGIPYLGSLTLTIGVKATLAGIIAVSLEKGSFTIPGFSLPVPPDVATMLPSPWFPGDPQPAIFSLNWPWEEVIPPREVQIWYPNFTLRNLILRCEAFGKLGIQLLYSITAGIGSKLKLDISWDSNNWNKILIQGEWEAIYVEFEVKLWYIFKIKITVKVVVIKALPKIEFSNQGLSLVPSSTPKFDIYIFGVKTNL